MKNSYVGIGKTPKVRLKGGKKISGKLKKPDQIGSYIRRGASVEFIPPINFDQRKMEGMTVSEDPIIKTNKKLKAAMNVLLKKHPEYGEELNPDYFTFKSNEPYKVK